MRTTDQNSNATLSKKQFITLCNEVATEAPEVWKQNPQIEKKTALLKYLLSKVQTKLGVFYPSFPAHEGKTPQETAYLSSLTNVCNVLTYFGKVAIDYDCVGTITEELFNKVREYD